MCTTFFFFFKFFFARTAEEITHFIMEIDRVGGFLQSHGSDFQKVYFFSKNMHVFVENIHLQNNNKVDCKNFEEHSCLCFPTHVYWVNAKFRNKKVILLQIK